MKYFLSSLAFAAAVFAGESPAQPAHAVRQTPLLVFHFGITPAAIVQEHPAQHPERSMHGGVARNGGSHLVLALFDTATGRRIPDAVVHASVSSLGGATVTKRLEGMLIAGQPSFGGYFHVDAPGIYRIRFEASVSGYPGPATADFEHRVLGPERRR
jgi:hypothetical protein